MLYYNLLDSLAEWRVFSMQWQLQDAKNQLLPQTSLLDFFQNSPLHGTDLELKRSQELPREIE